MLYHKIVHIANLLVIVIFMMLKEIQFKVKLMMLKEMQFKAKLMMF